MIADDKPFPKSAAVVVAELAKDGKVTLKIDGTVVAQGKTPGAMRYAARWIGSRRRPQWSRGSLFGGHEICGKVDAVKLQLIK